MDLATQDDVVKRLGRDLTDDEIERLPGLLEEASAIVESYCGTAYTDDDTVPPKVTIVVSRMVARVFREPEGTEGINSTQMSAGSFQLTRNYTTRADGGGPWLTRADRMMLGSNGISLGLVSERTA